MSKALPCIVCGQELENVFDDLPNQPSKGLAFKSEGHYGGTVFDPMDGSYLEVNICDPCLTIKADNGVVLVCLPAPPKPVDPVATVWTGPKEGA